MKNKNLISELQAIQEQYHHLPREALERLSVEMDTDMQTVLGVATFYSQFRLQPAGKHRVRVCSGTACHVKGAQAVHDAIKGSLNIGEMEDTDSEKQFTVEKVACIGCCMLAPAVQIDSLTYGPVEPIKAGSVIADFKKDNDQGKKSVIHKTISSVHAKGEIRICNCSSCMAAGAGNVISEIQSQISLYAYPVHLKFVGCTGSSWETPLVELNDFSGNEFRYGKVCKNQIRTLLQKHFQPQNFWKRGQALLASSMSRFLLNEDPSHIVRYGANTRGDSSIQFFGPQKHITTEHQGSLEPLDLDEYTAHGGFDVVRNCLNENNRQGVIALLKESGLRGRGGGGFPTWKKWEMVASSPETIKYIICNGDEGDPGAFMDRMILESFPFRVIEGLIIAALTVGAEEAYAYIRAEYALAIERFSKALEICRSKGILGQSILGSQKNVDIHLVSGAGAFVCGEETALIESIQGKRGMPRLRPPYPVEKGLDDQPTLVNNVETLASIPWILREGAVSFAAMGTASSKGTKTFALAGKVNRSGLIEVPMGVTIRQIVEDIGGGISNGKQLKAVQIGGPSGGCIPASLCDLPIDYETLQRAGAIMGSGGLIVLDEDDCMVDLARYFMEFIQDESCGKCTFCRVGTKRMLEILERICGGKGQANDLDMLEQLGRDIQQNSLCGLGRTGSNPVLSTLAHFRSEYEAHINGRCPSGKCKDLIHYKITENCIGCTICVQHCSSRAIPFTPYEIHTIDDALCTRCDACKQVCPTQGAIIVE